jgi:hypothetical protein
MRNTPRFYQVEKNPSLIRDMNTQAILNKDIEKLNAYKKERDYRFRVNKMVEEFDDVKSDILEIKNLLKKILNK